MKKPNLELFNLDILIKNINSSLVESEEPIKLGEFIEKESNVNLLKYGINKLNDMKIDVQGKYLLLQPHKFPMIHPFNMKGNIGYVFIEKGETDTSTDYPATYESVKLRIKKPLKLEGGLTIPKCTIKISKESPEGVEGKDSRQDHINVLNIGWRKADLKYVLPSECFVYIKQLEKIKKESIPFYKYEPAFTI